MYKYALCKTFSCMTAILIILTAAVMPIHASQADTAYSWYCSRTRDHLRPVADKVLGWVTPEEFSAYHIDPNCSDDNTSENKILYLTFDVGYENGNVSRVLDTLADRGVKGSFFILSHIVENEPALLKRMFDQGHTVANHTMHHKDMSRIGDPSEFAYELQGLDDLCFKKSGHHLAKFYRPPEGRFNRQNLLWAKAMGYRTIFWSFAYADWDNEKQPDPAEAVEKIITSLHNGAVLLLHPTSETNARILGEIIDRCHALGYRFETLEHLCKEGEETH